MKTMTVKKLFKAMRGVDLNAEIVFQANEPGEEDEGTDNATHTFACGTVFSAFVRPGKIKGDSEFVIDGAVTERE